MIYKIQQAMDKNKNLTDWLKAKALKVYEEKDLVLQLFLLFMLFSFLCVALPVLSGITEFTELYYTCEAESSSTGLFLAVLFLALIEIPKVLCWGAIFVKWFSKKMDYIGVFLIIAVTAQFFSIWLSMKGAQRVPELLSTDIEYIEPNLINIDSLTIVHNAIIEEKEQIDSLFFERYKKIDAITGNYRLSSSYKVDQRANKQDIRTAEQEKSIALKEAKAVNNKRIAEAKRLHLLAITEQKTKINVSSSRMWYWSIVIEVLFIASSLFVFWYLYLVLDTDNETANETVKTPINTKEERIIATANETANGTFRPAIAHLGTNKKKRITDNCLSCNKDITDKRIDAKYCSGSCRVNHYKAIKK